MKKFLILTILLKIILKIFGDYNAICETWRKQYCVLLMNTLVFRKSVKNMLGMIQTKFRIMAKLGDLGQEGYLSVTFYILKTEAKMVKC